jgi:hypothetical protein
MMDASIPFVGRNTLNDNDALIVIHGVPNRAGEFRPALIRGGNIETISVFERCFGSYLWGSCGELGYFDYYEKGKIGKT